MYEIHVTVDTVHLLYIHITTEHHTSQYPIYRTLFQRECLTFK